MKYIVIEYRKNGGNITVLTKNEKEEISDYFQNKYSNSLDVLKDFKTYVIEGGNIKSFETNEYLSILSMDDGTVINLLNFNHEFLQEEINSKIFDSFKNFVQNMHTKNIKNIYISTQLQKGIFYTTEISPNLRKGTTAFFQLELDKEGNLTNLSRQMLEFLINIEFKTWKEIFLCNDESNIFKVYYDTKKMSVVGEAIDYVKPIAMDIQKRFLHSSVEYKEEDTQKWII